jgi:hypothetical protein
MQILREVAETTSLRRPDIIPPPLYVPRWWVPPPPLPSISPSTPFGAWSRGRRRYRFGPLVGPARCAPDGPARLCNPSPFKIRSV